MFKAVTLVRLGKVAADDKFMDLCSGMDYAAVRLEAQRMIANMRLVKVRKLASNNLRIVEVK